MYNVLNYISELSTNADSLTVSVDYKGLKCPSESAGRRSKYLEESPSAKSGVVVAIRQDSII